MVNPDSYCAAGCSRELQSDSYLVMACSANSHYNDCFCGQWQDTDVCKYSFYTLWSYDPIVNVG
uniref:Uncharacterized protein n=1 Tax=Anguilla anguilla TaxID=7936 RepID=A0A0E9SK21_ANGAN